jgi:hypothetical protein
MGDTTAVSLLMNGVFLSLINFVETDRSLTDKFKARHPAIKSFLFPNSG